MKKNSIVLFTIFGFLLSSSLLMASTENKEYKGVEQNFSTRPTPRSKSKPSGLRFSSLVTNPSVNEKEDYSVNEQSFFQSSITGLIPGVKVDDQGNLLKDEHENLISTYIQIDSSNLSSNTPPSQKDNRDRVVSYTKINESNFFEKEENRNLLLLHENSENFF